MLYVLLEFYADQCRLGFPVLQVYRHRSLIAAQAQYGHRGRPILDAEQPNLPALDNGFPEEAVIVMNLFVFLDVIGRLKIN